VRALVTGVFLALVLCGGALAGVGLDRRLDDRDATLAVRAMALTIDHDLAAAGNALSATASRLARLEARPTEVLGRALDELRQAEPMLFELAVLDSDGKVLASTAEPVRDHKALGLPVGSIEPSTARRAALARPGTARLLRSGTTIVELGARVGDLEVVGAYDLLAFADVLRDAELASGRVTRLTAGQMVIIPAKGSAAGLVVSATAGEPGLAVGVGPRQVARTWLMWGLVCVAAGGLGLGLGGRARSSDRATVADA
jgi:hypothetical protein